MFYLCNTEQFISLTSVFPCIKLGNYMKYGHQEISSFDILKFHEENPILLTLMRYRHPWICDAL